MVLSLNEIARCNKTYSLKVIDSEIYTDATTCLTNDAPITFCKFYKRKYGLEDLKRSELQKKYASYIRKRQIEGVDTKGLLREEVTSITQLMIGCTY